MILLWIIMALMCLLAVSFVIWPLLLNRNKSRQEAVLIIIAAFAICLLAPLLYLSWGSSKLLSTRLILDQRAAELRQELGSPKKVIEKLQQRLAEDPASAQGWYLLGKLYFSQQDFTAAAKAYAKANVLKVNDPDIMVQYAQALYFAAQHKMDQKIAKLLTHVLQLQADNSLAINLLAIDAYQHQHYQQAIKQWQQLLNQYPPNSEDHQAVMTAIENAQQALDQIHHKLKIKVEVTLTSALKNQIAPDDTVFIYARKAQGSPMPLAITRVQAKNLPLQVTLDQTMAMSPTNTLANAKEVIIIARVSKSGNAMPQAGDLQGQSKQIKLPPGKQEASVKIEIDKQL